MSLTRALAQGALIVAGAAMLAMTVIVAWAVFGRFVLNDTPTWAEQSAMLLLGWAIMGAAAAGVREGTHMGFDVFQHALPPRARNALGYAADAVVAAFGAAMAGWGFELAAGVWDDTLPTTGLPGGALISLFACERLWLRARGRLAETPAVMVNE